MTPKKLNNEDKCPHCQTLVKRIDKVDVTKSFFAVKGMTIDHAGNVASKCNQCGGSLIMPVKKVKHQIKSTVVRKVYVKPKN